MHGATSTLKLLYVFSIVIKISEQSALANVCIYGLREAEFHEGQT